MRYQDGRIYIEISCLFPISVLNVIRVWCSWMMLSNKLMNFMSGSEWLVELR